MSISYDFVKDFENYLEYYPCDDEEGYDGIHNGGIMGLSDNAPENAKKAYKRYVELIAEGEKEGIRY